MSISTYTELQTALGNWAGRADLTARLPEFITLAEAKMNRHLRTINMVTNNPNFSITGEYVPVPPSFAGVKTFYLNASTRIDLERMTGDVMLPTYGDVTGKPRGYSVQGSNFRFAPVPDGTYSATLVYYMSVPPLASNATNWVLASHPDAYMYGGMAELSSYLKNFDAAKGWIDAMYQVLEDVKSSSGKSQWGTGPLSVRLG